MSWSDIVILAGVLLIIAVAGIFLFVRFGHVVCDLQHYEASKGKEEQKQSKKNISKPQD